MEKKVLLGILVMGSLGMCPLAHAMQTGWTDRYGRGAEYGNHPGMFEQWDQACLGCCLASTLILVSFTRCCDDCAKQTGEAVGLSPRPQVPAVGVAMTESQKNK